MPTLDCGNVISSLFTDAELKVIGTSIVAVISAAALLTGAYVAQLANRWRKWDK